ncbi:hypothetical protein KIW84_013830 [Lathyrus oleraceus]|uniref:RBR-type E3 ubiquitin transferase n=1 Tax=Pisum sativum TaxID=3888 RepID=A0A9D5GYQ1_PEA|nr:hypothetical protein KIW84_013830 [Pisum sativum]
MTRMRRGGGVPPSTTVVVAKPFLFSPNRNISTIINLCKQEGNNSRIISYIPETIPFVCEICTEAKTMKDAFDMRACSHTYCSDCVVMYIDSNLKNNIASLRCPFIGCSGLLEADSCRKILPAEIFDRWGRASCEALFDVSLKVYCPFADCSALLVKDRKEEVIGKTKCPNCKRIFCAECKVSWHEGIECSEFEKLNAYEKDNEGVMLMRLAKEMEWRRCPTCRFYVARSEGCDHMICRLKVGGEYPTRNKQDMQLEQEWIGMRCKEKVENGKKFILNIQGF